MYVHIYLYYLYISYISYFKLIRCLGTMYIILHDHIISSWLYLYVFINLYYINTYADYLFQLDPISRNPSSC